MNRATPQLRSLAKHLIVSETLRNNSSEAKNPAAFHHVAEELRPHLVTLIGAAGFRALLSRALAVATVEVPWLRAVQVQPDGVLEGLDELRRQLNPTEFLEGKVVLLAQLLGLLVAFMGTSLTTRLMDEIWGCGLAHKTASVTHYRKRAREMRKLAADHTAEDVRNEIISLADDYDRIALSADGTSEIPPENIDFGNGEKK